MKVDILHRDDLRLTAAGRTTLHTEAGSKTGFAQAGDGLLSNQIECITQAHRGRCFALARWCWRHRCNEYEITLLLILKRTNKFAANLRLVMAVGQQLLLWYAEARAYLLYRLKRCSARYGYITHLFYLALYCYALCK